MATQLLIYERAVPVSRRRHGGHSVRAGRDFSFARSVNSVPLMEAEFAAAAVEYTIVFAGSEADLVPVILLGIRDGENLFVDDAGVWTAKYVPAFVRRYPFVFSSADAGKTFTLCIDEEFPGLNTEGRGERLFDADGEQTQYLKNVLTFLQAYQVQFRRTQSLCRAVKDLGLLDPMQAQVTLKSGQRMTLGGFWTVNRERLEGLSADVLGGLAKSGDLERIHLHLWSLRNFAAMADKIGSHVVAQDQEAVG